MPNEIAKPKDIAELVRDRVRLQIVEALPDEAVDGLVEKEFKAFFEERQDPYNRSVKKPSLFNEMVQREFDKQIGPLVEESVRNALAEMQEYDDIAKKYVLKPEVIKALAPLVMEGWINDRLSQVLQGLPNLLQNPPPPVY